MKKKNKITSFDILERLDTAEDGYSATVTRHEFILFRELAQSGYIAGQVGPDSHSADATMVADVALTADGRMLLERWRSERIASEGERGCTDLYSPKTEVPDIVKLRRQLTSFQRQLLTTICTSYLKTETGVVARVMHLKLGKRRVREAFSKMGGLVEEREDYQAGHRYAPTFVGLLIGPDGKSYEDLLVRYLEYVEQMVKADPEKVLIKSADVAKALALTSSESALLYRLLMAGNLWSGTAFVTSDLLTWETRVFEFVDELPDWTSKRAFLHDWALKQYAPGNPVFLTDRQQFHSTPKIAAEHVLTPEAKLTPAPESPRKRLPAQRGRVKRFRVALSFPGEKRDFVKQVAQRLAMKLGKASILYDEYLTAELARPELDVYLAKLYLEDSELLVPFFCADYQQKDWCQLEWRQMRDIIKRRAAHQVMPFRFDDTPISGVLSTDGYVRIGDRPPAEVAELICERLTQSNEEHDIPGLAAGQNPVANGIEITDLFGLLLHGVKKNHWPSWQMGASPNTQILWETDGKSDDPPEELGRDFGMFARHGKFVLTIAGKPAFSQLRRVISPGEWSISLIGPNAGVILVKIEASYEGNLDLPINVPQLLRNGGFSVTLKRGAEERETTGNYLLYLVKSPEGERGWIVDSWSKGNGAGSQTIWLGFDMKYAERLWVTKRADLYSETVSSIRKESLPTNLPSIAALTSDELKTIKTLWVHQKRHSKNGGAGFWGFVIPPTSPDYRRFVRGFMSLAQRGLVKQDLRGLVHFTNDGFTLCEINEDLLREGEEPWTKFAPA